MDIDVKACMGAMRSITHTQTHIRLNHGIDHYKITTLSSLFKIRMTLRNALNIRYKYNNVFLVFTSGKF